MKVLFPKLLRQAVVLFLVFFITQNFLHAQHNPAEPDTTFGLETFNGAIRTTVVQPDGKILVGGEFTYFKTIPVNYIARLNSDGTLDNTFNLGSGTTGTVFSIAYQPDGKVLVGGNFSSFNGVSKSRLVRLNADGSIDNTFNILGANSNSTVYSIAIQRDRKILIGGDFTSFGGVSKNCLVRLNEDGTVDNTFNIGSGASGSVYSIVLQPDGKALVGGNFISFNEIIKNRLVRLKTDGAVDEAFNIGSGANNWVRAIAVQTDGKILVGGDFTSFGGVSNKCVRLNSDGSIDNTFNIGSGATNYVRSIILQPNGKILIGGYFYLSMELLKTVLYA